MARSLCSDSVTQLTCMVRGHSATTGVLPAETGKLPWISWVDPGLSQRS